MVFLDLLEGPLSSTYFSSLILMILLLMLIMSFCLFLNRRKKAYFSLTLSLLVVMAPYILLILSGSTAGSLENPIGLGAQLLKAISFIFLNLSLYQMYNTSRVKPYLAAYSGVLLSVLVLLVPHLYLHHLRGTPEQILLLKNLGLELFMFLALFLAYQWVTPWVGQWGRYQLSLTFYFIYQLLTVADLYLIQQPIPYLPAVTSLFLICYYITLFIFIFQRVVELLQATYTKSITDALTGLYNRRFFMSRLGQYLTHGIPVTVIFSDIDNFKRLNDTLGHEQGDEALKKVATILKELSEDIGISGRLGGEEMVMLVTEARVDVEELTEQLRARIEAEAGVTVSIGYSKSRKGISADQLVKQADEAMYAAKTTGKNKVCKYSKSKAQPVSS